jgi:CheY-like chemotaxis protein
MPRMDGFELYKQIKKIDGRINAVFVTASEVNYEALRTIDRLDISDDEDKAAILRGSREGDEERIHFIRKPVEINEFIQRVNKELKEESRINQQRRSLLKDMVMQILAK